MNTAPQARNLRFLAALILLAAAVALAVVQTSTYPSSPSATPPPYLGPTPAPGSYGSSSYPSATPAPTPPSYPGAGGSSSGNSLGNSSSSYNSSGSGSTTYLPSGPAASLVYAGNANFQVPLSRAGHAFDFRYVDAANIRHSMGSYVMGLATGAPVAGGPAVPLYLAVAAFSPVSPFNPAGLPGVADWWLVDTTANQEGPHRMLGLTNAEWRATSGVTNRYYALPAARRGHALIAGGTPGGWATLLQGQLLGSYTTAAGGVVTYSPLAWFEAWAPAGPEPYAVADLSAGEIAPQNQTDLASAAWAYDTARYPMAAVTLYLEGREAGHRFTVHSGTAGGPVFTASVAAAGGMNATWPAADGRWTYGPADNYFQVPAASASLTANVGLGMSFWVTREADGLSTVSAFGGPFAATLTGPPSNAAGYNWSIFGAFPDPPQRAAGLEAHTFRLNAATRGAHDFTVRLSDGYQTYVSSTDLTWGQLENWDDLGVQNPLPIVSLTASVDPTRAWWLHDEASGEDFAIGRTDVLDGWVPLHTAPPPDATITLRLPASRATDWFQAYFGAPFNGALDFHGSDSATAALETFPGADGMADYTLSTLTRAFANPLPYETGPFPWAIQRADGTTETASLLPGDNDLRRWLPAPQPLALSISSSRWEHELLLRHPNGEAYPVTKYQTLGGQYFDPSGDGWQVSYYYFDATATHHPELPWYLEDASTAERLGPNPSNDALINWAAIADPKNLVGTENADGTFSLTWHFAETSTEGAFQMERRASPSEPWEIMDTLPAADLLDTATPPSHTARLAHAPWAVSQPGKTASLRVYYAYGGQRSAPSNEIVLSNPDSDGDGLPDAWERLWNLNPNDAADARARNPQAGATAEDLYKHGATPGSDGPPAAEDWTKRLSLWGSADFNVETNDEHNRERGTALVWDGEIKPGMSVTIEREHTYGQWVAVRTVTATDQYAFVADSDHEDPNYYFHAWSGEGRSFSDEPNFRLRGGHPSNETVRRVRLMMRTGSVGREQPGIQEFDGTWFPEGTTRARKYYRHAQWSGSSNSGSHHSTSSGSFTYDDTANAESMTTQEDNDGTVKTSALGDRYPQPYPTGANGSNYVTWTPESAEPNGSWTSVWHRTQNVLGPPFSEEWSFAAHGPVAPLELPREARPTGPARRHVHLTAPPPNAASSEWTLELSQEYTAGKFYTDAKLLLPAIPTSKLEGSTAYKGAGRGGAYAWAGYLEQPPRCEGSRYHVFDRDPWYFGGTDAETSRRSSPGSLSSLYLSRSSWWLECNDCLPGPTVTVIEYEQRYEDDDYTPLGEKIPTRIISVAPGSDPGHIAKSETAHSDVTAAPGNRKRYLTRLPVTLLVDANRDGEIDDSDVTSKDRPYRFWLNDDDDTETNATDVNGDPAASEADQLPPTQPDWKKHAIVSKRNLEDFSRLWIYLGGIQDAVIAGKIKVGLKWKTIASGAPVINIYQSADPMGSATYLSEDAAAADQVNVGVQPDKNGKEAVDANGPFIFSTDFWADLSSSHPNKYLIFEGAGEGKGQLEFVFLDQSGNQIGEGPSVWLDLKDIKTMYQQFQVKPKTLTPPFNSATNEPYDANNANFEKMQGRPKFEQAPDEEKKVFVFVNGSNESYLEATNRAETMFKRLFWQGYKGRLVSFRWETLIGPADGQIPAQYNLNEWIAWTLGESLKKFMASSKIPSDYIRNVGSHSLGCSLVSAALVRGMQATSVVFMQGAIPAGCFDTDGGRSDPNSVNGFLDMWIADDAKPTPDNAAHLGYRGFVSDALGANPTVTIHSFYNIRDYALNSGPGLPGTLGVWEGNQQTYKPD